MYFTFQISCYFIFSRLFLLFSRARARVLFYRIFNEICVGIFIIITFFYLPLPSLLLLRQHLLLPPSGAPCVTSQPWNTCHPAGTVTSFIEHVTTIYYYVYILMLLFCTMQFHPTSSDRVYPLPLLILSLPPPNVDYCVIDVPQL